MSDLLAAEGIQFSYGEQPVLTDVGLTLSAGRLVAVLGPNGSGKSTLIKVLLGHLPGQKPIGGQIAWQGRDLADWRRRDLARLVAYLPQSPAWDGGQSVCDVLRLGRAPYWGALGLESADDERTVLSVSQMLGLSRLLDRAMDCLSGGQRQRVLLGRCLVQQPRAMLLDEPDTFLDLKHQIDLCGLLRDLARNNQLGVLMASHDLNLAAAFADEVIVLREGRIVARGEPGEVLRPAMLEEVYGVAMERIDRAGLPPVLIPRAKNSV